MQCCNGKPKNLWYFEGKRGYARLANFACNAITVLDFVGFCPVLSRKDHLATERICNGKGKTKKWLEWAEKAAEFKELGLNAEL